MKRLHAQSLALSTLLISLLWTSVAFCGVTLAPSVRFTGLPSPGASGNLEYPAGNVTISAQVQSLAPFTLKWRLAGGRDGTIRKTPTGAFTRVDIRLNGMQPGNHTLMVTAENASGKSPQKGLQLTIKPRSSGMRQTGGAANQPTRGGVKPGVGDVGKMKISATYPQRIETAEGEGVAYVDVVVRHHRPVTHYEMGLSCSSARESTSGAMTGNRMRIQYRTSLATQPDCRMVNLSFRIKDDRGNWSQWMRRNSIPFYETRPVTISGTLDIPQRVTLATDGRLKFTATLNIETTRGGFIEEYEIFRGHRRVYPKTNVGKSNVKARLNLNLDGDPNLPRELELKARANVGVMQSIDSKSFILVPPSIDRNVLPEIAHLRMTPNEFADSMGGATVVNFRYESVLPIEAIRYRTGVKWKTVDQTFPATATGPGSRAGRFTIQIPPLPEAKRENHSNLYPRKTLEVMLKHTGNKYSNTASTWFKYMVP